MIRPLMNTHEVADYLRIKERKVYELVAQRRIPCTRAAGKWLFPKELIDQWLSHSAESVGTAVRPVKDPPPIFSGSHDPLLDWAVRESACGLALLFNGSLDGFERFADQQAMACGIHLLDVDSGAYNVPLLEQRLATQPVVAFEWARRQQGLLVRKGNPLGFKSVADVVNKPFAMRQKEAGSYLLLQHLLRNAGLELADLSSVSAPLRSEVEVAMTIAAGQADAGLGVAAAAHSLNLDFVPLVSECYDIVIWRRQFFSPQVQKLLAFTRRPEFSQRAEELGGYDIRNLGQVRFNAVV